MSLYAERSARPRRAERQRRTSGHPSQRPIRRRVAGCAAEQRRREPIWRPTRSAGRWTRICPNGQIALHRNSHWLKIQ